MQKGGRLDFTLEYRDARNTTIEPAVIWAELSFDFKRVSFPGAILPVSITFEHPFSPDDDANKWFPTELELIEEFALQTTEGVCLNGWIESIKDGTQGVRYEKACKKERVTLELQELASQKELTKLPDKFYKTYTDWKEKYLIKPTA